MPALEISRSMLVNQGLSAAALPGAVADISDVAAASSVDILGSFKQVVTAGNLAVADQDLVKAIVAFTSPLDLATYFINAKYGELGGAGGVLGATATAVAAAANGAGFFRTFQNGAIYWHPQVGAHEVHGPIRVRWQELGGEKGFLGFPTTDVTAGADVRSEGFFAHFQGGSIYWAPPAQSGAALSGSVVSAGVMLSSTVASAGSTSATAAINPAVATLSASAPASGFAPSVTLPRLEVAAQAPIATAATSPASGRTTAATGVQLVDVAGIKTLIESSAGAFEVHGAIREKYLALGAEASILGYPRTDETGTPDGVGRFNHFQSGSIYWTPGTSAHEVHGLIRDRWAGLGWERNPQLGYPITDELIPDPRIGHRRPEVRKKPVLEMPSDVIKLPADAAAAGFPRTVVNTPVLAAAVAPASSALTTRAVGATQTVSSVSGALGRLSDKPVLLEPAATAPQVIQPAVSVALDPGLIAALANPATPASTPGQRSVNRFADFESGVLFWFRGATSASTLSPLASTADGTSLALSGADIAAAAMSKIGRSTFETGNVQLASMTFVGTTGYSFDGAQVHNRRHRLQIILQGIETQTVSGPLNIPITQPVAVTASIELQVEVWFDASQRRIALAPTDWSLTHASSASYAEATNLSLRAKLDPLLWTSFELLTLPDTDAGAPIAVLSVKTQANGSVGTFVEPQPSLVLSTVGQLVNAVTPSVVLFSQPTN